MIRGALTAMLAALLLPAAASAAVHVPAGRTVNELTVFGSSVRVDGTTLGRVIVVDGELTVGPRGRVAGATVIGGRIRTEQGGRIVGDVFQFGGTWPRPWSSAALALLGLVLALRLLVVWIVVTSAALLARRAGLRRLAHVASERPLRTVAIGVLACFALSASTILLAVTVVGLVVAAALAALLLVGTTVGVALVLRPVGEDSRDARRLALVALAVPLIGDGLAALAAAAGLGALLRQAAGTTSETFASDPLIGR